MRGNTDNNSASAFILLALAISVGIIACFGGIEGRNDVTAYDDEVVSAVTHNH